MGLPALGATTGGQFSSVHAPAIVAVGTIVLLLGLFAITAIILMRMYHRRLDVPRRSSQTPQLDAWEEAGRRMGLEEEGTKGQRD